jgi:hypothetical protein
MIAYRVNSKIFYNTFLAAHESFKSGKPVEFYCNDHLYDLHDWTVEPHESLDELMKQHAESLRNRYQRIVLMYSGGTDSQTIYNVFAKNNIHIDEIIIKVSDTNPAYPYSVYKWLLDYHPDPTTIITYYEGDDTELRSKEITSDNWIFENRGDLYKFNMPASGLGVKFLCEKNHAGHKWIAITGCEKPRLIYRDGQWFSRQLDVVLRPLMGYDYLEHFFLEPRIHIKQSHLFKHAVKKLIAKHNLPLYNNDWAESKWPNTQLGYREFALASGRHLELNDGASFLQKKINGNIKEIDTSAIELNSFETTLIELYNNQDIVARNYVNGIKNLHAEKGFVNFLNENFLKNPNSNELMNTKFIWSKEYNLGA